MQRCADEDAGRRGSRGGRDGDAIVSVTPRGAEWGRDDIEREHLLGYVGRRRTVSVDTKFRMMMMMIHPGGREGGRTLAFPAPVLVKVKSASMQWCPLLWRMEF